MASWAVSTDKGRVYSKIIGADRTSAASERWAAYFCTKAINKMAAEQRATIVIDNSAVCGELRRFWRYGWRQPLHCVG